MIGKVINVNVGISKASGFIICVDKFKRMDGTNGVQVVIGCILVASSREISYDEFTLKLVNLSSRVVNGERRH